MTAPATDTTQQQRELVLTRLINASPKTAGCLLKSERRISTIPGRSLLPV
jgi:hypothetical protein